MASVSYTGSRFLAPVGESLGMNIDQVNFLATIVFALALGYPFRTLLGPCRASPLTRHIFEIAAGTALMTFLFGWSVFVLVFQSLSCYLLIRILPNGSMPKIVTFVALLELSAYNIWMHLHRYGSLADIGVEVPVMINTQRMSALAWSVYDGQVKDTTKLSEKNRKLALSRMPSLVELMSYCLNFHGVMSGPFCFFKDYISFIEGTNLIKNIDKKDSDRNQNVLVQHEGPSPMRVVLQRLLEAVLCSPVVLVLFSVFPIQFSPDAEIYTKGFFAVWLYSLIITATRRYKLYVAWKLMEASNNNAGLGFYYDENGEERWDLVDTVHIKKTELATNLKMFLDNWNIVTTHWLRYIIYDRVPFMKAELVFFVSMLWHGFYPGYYLTAVSAAIFMFAAKLVRRNVRPWFITGTRKHFVYDVITIISTRLAISYMGFPFQHLYFGVSVVIYKRLFFFLHIVTFLIVFLVSLLPKEKQTKKLS